MADTGILLVAYGSSEPATRPAMERIRDRAAVLHPSLPLFMAYTSESVRAKLIERGETAPSVRQGLERAAGAGVARLAVQSLHTIPGEEYEKVVFESEAFAKRAPQMRIVAGEPLLASDADVKRAADGALDGLERGQEEAVVFVGHGSRIHAAHEWYPRLDRELQSRDSRAMLGTLSGEPGMDEIRARLRGLKAEKVLLAPFMCVAGYHARKDMAGDGPDSWSSALARDGFDCRVLLKGTAWNERLLSIWLDHLGAAMAALDAPS